MQPVAGTFALAAEFCNASQTTPGCNLLLPFVVHQQLPVQLLVALRGFDRIEELFRFDEVWVSIYVVWMSQDIPTVWSLPLYFSVHGCWKKKEVFAPAASPRCALGTCWSETAEKRWCLPQLLDTRVGVCMHVPPCAGVGFLEVLKNIPLVLWMRHVLIRSFKLLASHSLQWLQCLVPRFN